MGVHIDSYKERDHLIELCFACYVERGIENITDNDFCSAANLNSDMLYSYFKDKDEILFECVRYGYNRLENAMFDVVDNCSMEEMYSKLIEVCNTLSAELKFMYYAFSKRDYTNKRLGKKQVTYKQVYEFLKSNSFYDTFGEKIACRLGCPYDVILVSVHDFLTFMTNYGLWGGDALSDSSIARFNNILNDAAEYKKQLI